MTPEEIREMREDDARWEAQEELRAEAEEAERWTYNADEREWEIAVGARNA